MFHLEELCWYSSRICLVFWLLAFRGLAFQSSQEKLPGTNLQIQTISTEDSTSSNMAWEISKMFSAYPIQPMYWNEFWSVWFVFLGCPYVPFRGSLDIERDEVKGLIPRFCSERQRYSVFSMNAMSMMPCSQWNLPIIIREHTLRLHMLQVLAFAQVRCPLSLSRQILRSYQKAFLSLRDHNLVEPSTWVSRATGRAGKKNQATMARVAEMSQKNAHGWNVILDAFPYLKASSFAPTDDFSPSS